MFNFLLIIMLVLGLVLLLAASVVIHLAKDIRRRGRSQRPLPADVAIILGAYTDGFRPSPALTARLKAGLHLYRMQYVNYLIVSGGRGADETVSEARSMKRFLVMNGVPPEAIVEDQWSSDTWENLRNSQVVMKHNGWRSAIVVTSDYHLPRALAVAKQLDIEATGYCPNSDGKQLNGPIRELVAWGKYLVSGRATLKG